MALTQGVVLRAGDPRTAGATLADPLLAPGPSPKQARRLAREAADGHAEAARVLEAARARAADVTARAEERAAAAAEAAGREARAREAAKLGAAWLALRAREERAAEREHERVIEVAVALAERLVGTALELSPDKIVPLARLALAEARGTRRAVLEAHPDDAVALAAHVAELGLPADAIEVRANIALARGDLSLHTDLGTLDAKLAARLDHLAAALRDVAR